MQAQEERHAPYTDAAIPPRLRPHVHSSINSFLNKKTILFDLAEKFSSPLNLVFPQNMKENIKAFQDVYRKHRQRGKIHFTSKPCKSKALYRAAAQENICIDVSSPASLKTALDCGWEHSRISATGPKNREYLSVALQNDVLINVDNIDELQQIANMHYALGKSKPSRLTIRVSDTGPSAKNAVRAEDSTFGIRTEDMQWVIGFLKTQETSLDFKGFSYHGSIASDDQRIAAMENLLSLTFDAIKQKLKPTTLNLGGGFRVRYAESASEWTDYLDSLKKSVLGKIEPQIWNNSDLGYRVENRVIRGDGAFINHAPIHTKAEEFDRWLDSIFMQILLE